MVNQTQQTFREIQRHKEHVIELASRETENIINSRKHHHIVLGREQSNAANRLFGMLRTTEGRTNHLPVSYLCKETTSHKLKREESEGQKEANQKYPESGFGKLHKRSLLNTKGSQGTIKGSHGTAKGSLVNIKGSIK